MSLAEDFESMKAGGDVSCHKCLFFHSLPSHPAGYSGTCNLNPPQVVSHDGKLHYVFPAVAADWYCGHFSPDTKSP